MIKPLIEDYHKVGKISNSVGPFNFGYTYPPPSGRALKGFFHPKCLLWKYEKSQRDFRKGFLLLGL